MMSVNIYSHESKKPVFNISCLELAARCPIIKKLLLNIRICDGCSGQYSIIFADEDKDTLRAVFSTLSHFKKSGLTIIQGNV